MPLEKLDRTKVDAPVSVRARKGDDWVLYPELMEWLTEDRYPDGRPRITSTLSVFVQEGQVKASINDRDNDRVAFVASESLAGLLVVLDTKLKESSLDWRDSQGKRRPKK